MEKEKRNEIGLKLLRYKMREEGINLSKNTRRELGNIAKEINVSVDDLKEFIKEELKRQIDEMLE